MTASLHTFVLLAQIRQSMSIWAPLVRRFDEASAQRVAAGKAKVPAKPTTSQRATERFHMRKLIISEFMSLDGVIQAPGGKDEDRDGGFEHGGWTIPFWHDDIGQS